MRDTKIVITKITYSDIDRIPSYNSSIDIKISGEAIKLSGHAIESSLTKPYLTNNAVNVGYNNIFNFTAVRWHDGQG